MLYALEKCTDQCRTSLLKELRALQPTLSLMGTTRVITSIAHEFQGMASLKIRAGVENLRMNVVE